MHVEVEWLVSIVPQLLKFQAGRSGTLRIEVIILRSIFYKNNESEGL